VRTPYNIRVDLSDLLGANSVAVQSIFPQISAAVQMVAEEAAFRWKGAVMKARLWSGEKVPYVESIQWTMTGPYEAEVTTNYKLAGEIETGRPPRDLKLALQTSTKTRVVKDGPHKGQRYLLIPFRHNTPTSSGEGAHAPQMPSNVYALARNMAPSRVLPYLPGFQPSRVSGSGHVVPVHKYKWGGRLPAGLTPKLSPSHHSDIHAGMVRMDTSSGKQRSSAYLTFRVMGEWSSGWVVGPREGLFLARDVAAGLQPVLEQAIGKAVTLGMLRK
jgi:hypothetical protein